MKNLSDNDIFALENFEGPLDFLLHLIHKNEIDLSEVSLKRITEQYIQKMKEMIKPSVDSGAEFIATASFLLWLKSRMLLPRNEQNSVSDEEMHDPRFEIIHQLLEYCRFKDAAKELTQLEILQSAFYSRIPDPNLEASKTLGIEHLSVNDLALLFKNVLSKTSVESRIIQEEEWKVSDKIKIIQKILKTSCQIEIAPFFAAGKCKLELIVTFLAILEIMKMGEGHLIRDIKTQKIFLIIPPK